MRSKIRCEIITSMWTRNSGIEIQWDIVTFPQKNICFIKNPLSIGFLGIWMFFSIILGTINAYAMHLFPLHVCGDWVFSFKWNSILDFSSHVYLCHQSHLPLWRWWPDLKKIMSLICTWVMCSWCCPRMVKCAFDLHYSRVLIWLLMLLNMIIERIFMKRDKEKMCFFSYQLWLNLYKIKCVFSRWRLA